jgi:hypothetical protein
MMTGIAPGREPGRGRRDTESLMLDANFCAAPLGVAVFLRFWSPGPTVRSGCKPTRICFLFLPPVPGPLACRPNTQWESPSLYTVKRPTMRQNSGATTSRPTASSQRARLSIAWLGFVFQALTRISVLRPCTTALRPPLPVICQTYWEMKR